MYYVLLLHSVFKNSSTCCPHVQNQLEIIDKIDRSLVLKKFKQYTTRVERVELATAIEILNMNSTEDMNVQFTIRYTSQDADIFEEILIVDEISLIGSLGGSLGLFIGFSFFGYITTFLDVIVDQMFYMSTP